MHCHQPGFVPIHPRLYRGGEYRHILDPVDFALAVELDRRDKNLDGRVRDHDRVRLAAANGLSIVCKSTVVQCVVDVTAKTAGLDFIFQLCGTSPQHSFDLHVVAKDSSLSRSHKVP